MQRPMGSDGFLPVVYTLAAARCRCVIYTFRIGENQITVEFGVSCHGIESS